MWAVDYMDLSQGLSGYNLYPKQLSKNFNNQVRMMCSSFNYKLMYNRFQL